MQELPGWSQEPKESSLLDDEVHVWRASLNCSWGSLNRLWATLSGDEQARASEYVFAEDRDHYVAARGILRTILGRYLQRPAAAIVFDYGSAGKPRIRLDASESPLFFNLSHSHGIAVFGFSKRREIGIDVELVRPDIVETQLVEEVLTSVEILDWLAMQPSEQVEAFFTAWTRKEAYAKALGVGLGMQFNALTMPIVPKETVELASADHGFWTLRKIVPAKGYTGAVAAQGKDWYLVLSNWLEPL